MNLFIIDIININPVIFFLIWFDYCYNFLKFEINFHHSNHSNHLKQCKAIQFIWIMKYILPSRDGPSKQAFSDGLLSTTRYSCSDHSVMLFIQNRKKKMKKIDYLIGILCCLSSYKCIRSIKYQFKKMFETLNWTRI